MTRFVYIKTSTGIDAQIWYSWHPMEPIIPVQEHELKLEDLKLSIEELKLKYPFVKKEEDVSGDRIQL